MKAKRTVSLIKICLYMLLPVALWLLPATFFDLRPAICLSRLIFHVHCPGCGMTRSIMHLMHFDLRGALAFNRLSVVVFPILIYGWISDLKREFVFLNTRKKV